MKAPVETTPGHLGIPRADATLNRRTLLTGGSAFALLSTSTAVLNGAAPSVSYAAGRHNNDVSALEIISEMSIRPALVTVDRNGQIFATVHWFARDEPQMIKITGETSWEPWPSAEWNRGFGAGDNAFDQPLGILVDGKDRVWTVDCGIYPTLADGLPPEPNRSPRILAFDSGTGQNVVNLTLPESTNPIGTYPQDIAIDDENGFAFLADIGAGVRAPGIVVVNIETGEARRFDNHPSLEPENVNLMVEGRALVFPNGEGGFAPARIGINPITLSADNETIFYGPMCGLGYYALDARLLRDGASDNAIAASIRRIANKPVCDGIATDAEGNHFITNLGENAIDRIDADGVLTRLAQDDRLIWADGVRFGPDGWLYVSVNQLNRSPLFSGAGEQGIPPYYIMRINTGTEGLIGR
ncbi:MAG: L-dopachrome tautomerase-related protein [Pseudomonadota bacterium]